MIILFIIFGLIDYLLQQLIKYGTGTFIVIYLFFLFLYWFFHENNFYKTIMVFGKKGSGKTSYIAKQSQNFLKKGYKVYSNIEIPGTYLFDPQDLQNFKPEPESIVFCDEVGLIWDNRDFKSFSKGFNVFFKYSRQYKLRIYLFSQAWNEIDLKIRNLTDSLCYLTRIGKLSICKPIYKKTGLSVDSEGNGTMVDTYSFAPFFLWEFTYLPRYYGLFKSYDPPERELLQATYSSYNSLSEIYTDTKKLIIYKIHSFLKQIKLKILYYYHKFVDFIHM